MRDMSEINRKVMWLGNVIPGIKGGYVNLPTGIRAQVCVGTNEGGWEHVSVELCARRLPTWEEMCFIKDIFWEEEEEVVQMHPRKSEYVNIAEALHLWRPKSGDWTLMNRGVN